MTRKTEKPLTDSAIKALEVLRDHGPLPPREFGEYFWGQDHPGWRRISKAGPYGSTTGGGMNLAAGGYLGKLRKQGLVRITRESWGSVQRLFELSALGRQALTRARVETGAEIG